LQHDAVRHLVADPSQAAHEHSHLASSKANAWCGSQGLGVAASPFSQVAVQSLLLAQMLWWPLVIQHVTLLSTNQSKAYLQCQSKHRLLVSYLLASEGMDLIQVPENMAAVLHTTASSASGGMGEAVIEARRALRSVQDVMHSVVESAQVICMHLCVPFLSLGPKLCLTRHDST
jgi:hypothetical protein